MPVFDEHFDFAREACSLLGLDKEQRYHCIFSEKVATFLNEEGMVTTPKEIEQCYYLTLAIAAELKDSLQKDLSEENMTMAFHRWCKTNAKGGKIEEPLLSILLARGKEKEISLIFKLPVINTFTTLQSDTDSGSDSEENDVFTPREFSPLGRGGHSDSPVILGYARHASDLSRYRPKAIKKVTEREKKIITKLSLRNIPSKKHWIVASNIYKDKLIVSNKRSGGSLAEYIIYNKYSKIAATDKQKKYLKLLLNNIIQQLIALTFLHDQLNIVHLDMKPENILLDKDKNWFLIDFDNSIDLDDPEDKALLREMKESNLIKVSPLFAAPEMMTCKFNPESNDEIKSMDIWALGIILAQMLSDDRRNSSLVQKYFNKETPLSPDNFGPMIFACDKLLRDPDLQAKRMESFQWLINRVDLGEKASVDDQEKLLIALADAMTIPNPTMRPKAHDLLALAKKLAPILGLELSEAENEKITEHLNACNQKQNETFQSKHKR